MKHLTISSSFPAVRYQRSVRLARFPPMSLQFQISVRPPIANLSSFHPFTFGIHSRSRWHPRRGWVFLSFVCFGILSPGKVSPDGIPDGSSVHVRSCTFIACRLGNLSQYKSIEAFLFCFQFLRVNIVCILMAVVCIEIVSYVFINIKIV